MGLTNMVKFGSFLAAFLLLSGVASKSYAVTESIYSVYNQAIDETADNEVLAKRQGLSKAKREAFYKVLKRLARQSDYGRLPEADDATIEQMIRSTSLPQEKFTTGNGRYLAKLNVRFMPASIRGYLRAANIPYAEVQSKPLIVLPVFRTSGTTLLWEDSNQWFEAWIDQRLGDELVPMVMPLGDITDVGTISSLQASRGDMTKLNDISNKYGASGTLVTTATFSQDPTTNVPLVDVFGVVQGKGWEPTDFYLSFSSTPEVSTQDFLAQVAAATAAEVLAIWKQRNLLDSQGGVQNLIATAPLGGLKDWVSLEKSLKDVAGVRDVSLESLNTKQALVNLEFLGKSDQLQSALAQNDLLLEYQLADGNWLLTRKK